jgi:CelD/BcsL family acetyltransferase involved in cellulose biosynthesis
VVQRNVPFFGPATEPRPVIELLRGAAVTALFQDAAFRASVQRLYDRCPWGTAGQRPDFLRIWLEHYAAKFEPWLALARAADGELDGLLPLARNQDFLEYAGAYDCEYRVWLARPETSDAFIVAALEAIRARERLRIDLHLLPPATPLAWTRRPSRLLPYLEVSEEPRLVIPLSDPAHVARWVKERSRLRTAWNKLARTGKVSFRRVREPAEVDRVLARWAPMYDLRKGATYGLTPFRDDASKHPFLLAQASVPDLLHVTVLERDGELLAAHIATAGTRELSLMGVAHSEFEARLSPGSLLIFELVQLAAREGFQFLDMTPGTDSYKSRFASDREPVYSVTVHPSLVSSGKRHARVGLRAARRRVGAELAARAAAQPGGWAARALPYLKRGRRSDDDGKPTLRPVVGALSLEARLAATGPAPGWRRNHLDAVHRWPGPRPEFLALLRDLTTALRGGGELYTLAPGDTLAMAVFLVPGSLVNAGAPDDAQVLYLAQAGAALPPGEQAQALLALAGSLPDAARARLRLAVTHPGQQPLLALITAQLEPLAAAR